MLPVNDATKVVNLPFRPIGFKFPQGKKEVTMSDIKDWIKEKNPGSIQCLPHFAIWAGIGTIASVILGFIGIKKDNNFFKWGGGIWGIVGAAISAVGVYFGKLVKQIPEQEKKAKEEQEKKSEDAFQKILETSIINSLKSISEKNEAHRDKSRRDLISTHFSEIAKVKVLFEKIKLGNDDEKLRKEAECCLSIISEAEKEISDAIACLKDKSADKDDRYKAIDTLRFVQGNKAVIETLLNRVKDKSERPHGIREESLLALVQIQGYGAKELLLNMLQDPAEVHRGQAKNSLEHLAREFASKGDVSTLKDLMDSLVKIQISDDDSEGKKLIQNLITQVEKISKK